MHQIGALCTEAEKKKGLFEEEIYYKQIRIPSFPFHLFAECAFLMTFHLSDTVFRCINSFLTFKILGAEEENEFPEAIYPPS